MKKKFDKYWGNFDNTNLLLYVAVVLDPRYKLGYITYCLGCFYDAHLFQGKVLRKCLKVAKKRNLWVEKRCRVQESKSKRNEREGSHYL